MIKLWVVIGTYNKIEEAKLQIQLIRKVRTPIFENIKIIHVYNWDEEYNKELEDELIKINNDWHFIWAANLIDVWIDTILKKYDVDYILVTASDCWWMLPRKIKLICEWMRQQNNVIATCVRWYPWQLDRTIKWLACDTFIIDANNERKHPIFPLNAQEFLDKNSDMLIYNKTAFKVEKLLATRFIQSVVKYSKESDIYSICDWLIYHLQQRVPTMKSSWHLAPPKRNFDCKELWLYTNHDFIEKRKILNNITWI